MTPQMQALTLIEYALGNCSPTWANKHIPNLERIPPEDLTNLEVLAQKDYTGREATAYAEQLLAKVVT